MSQSKSPKPDDAPDPIVETIEEADPEKESTYPVQWEYHVMRVQDTANRLPASDLDALGALGWEMVAIFHLHATINFIFKRFVLPSSLALSGVEQMKRLDKLEKEKLEEMEKE